MKSVYFAPEDFGGYTFLLILSGSFMGQVFDFDGWFNITYNAVLSVCCFFGAMYFYSRSND